MDSHIQEHGGINGVSFQGLARTEDPCAVELKRQFMWALGR